jgi:hypothetical protein
MKSTFGFNEMVLIQMSEHRRTGGVSLLILTLQATESGGKRPLLAKSWTLELRNNPYHNRGALDVKRNFHLFIIFLVVGFLRKSLAWVTLPW